MSALREAGGCLTDAGLEALEQTPPGQAPEDLARHLADCARCQNRLLVRAGGPAGRRQAPKPRRSVWLTTALVLGIMLVALVALLATLSWLTTTPR